MKKAISALCILALLFSFAACAGHKTPSAPEGTEAPAAGPQEGALTLRVVDGAGTGLLVLAGESRDVYPAESGALTVYLDGGAAAFSDLQNGMLLTVDPDYTVLETWPGQLVGATVRANGDAGKEDHGDLCGLYLQVLEDLWNEDDGLNGGVAYISVDLDAAPGGLTEGEKAAVAWIFAGRHGAQGLTFGFEELKENGYIKENVLYWEDGLLMRIGETEKGSSAGTLRFNAQKWRSGDGAYFFNDCTAARGKGLSWEPYRVGGFAIS